MKKELNVLIVLSVLFIFGLFIPAVWDNPLGYAINGIIMVSYILWVFYILFGKVISFPKFFNGSIDKAEQQKEKGEIAASNFTTFAVAMCVVGLITLFLMMVGYFSIYVFQ